MRAGYSGGLPGAGPLMIIDTDRQKNGQAGKILICVLTLVLKEVCQLSVLASNLNILVTLLLFTFFSF